MPGIAVNILRLILSSSYHHLDPHLVDSLRDDVEVLLLPEPVPLAAVLETVSVNYGEESNAVSDRVTPVSQIRFDFQCQLDSYHGKMTWESLNVRDSLWSILNPNSPGSSMKKLR